MNGRKYLLALWLSITLYSVSSFSIGPMGILAYQRARSGLDRLRTNMEELKTINRNLGGAMDALRYDSDTIMVYARELGYGAPHEQFVRIVGLPGAAKKHTAAGQLILYTRPDMVSDRVLRVFSLFLGLALFLVLSILEHVKKRASYPGDSR